MPYILSLAVLLAMVNMNSLKPVCVDFVVMCCVVVFFVIGEGVVLEVVEIENNTTEA